MIKINLLPRTINQKRVVRNTALAFALLLVVIIGGGIAYGMKLRGDVAKMEEMATAAEQWEAKVKGIQQQAQQMRDSIKPIKEKLDFINQVLDYNLAYPKLYEQIARWTYEKITLYSLTCDGKEVKMAARAKSLDDVGRYLLNMYRATDLFTEVTISGIPSYKALQSGKSQLSASGGFTLPSEVFGPGGQTQGSQASLAGLGAVEAGVARTPINLLKDFAIDFQVTAKLRKPIEEPKLAGAPAAGTTTPGAPGFPSPEMGPIPGPGPGPGESPMMGPGGPGPAGPPPM
jgi:Tfp pilus assembly protein PilN